MSCFVPGMSTLCHCPPILNTLSPTFSPLFYNLYHSPPPILLSCFLSLHRILPTRLTHFCTKYHNQTGIACVSIEFTKSKRFQSDYCTFSFLCLSTPHSLSLYKFPFNPDHPFSFSPSLYIHSFSFSPHILCTLSPSLPLNFFLFSLSNPLNSSSPFPSHHL